MIRSKSILVLTAIVILLGACKSQHVTFPDNVRQTASEPNVKQQSLFPATSSGNAGEFADLMLDPKLLPKVSRLGITDLNKDLDPCDDLNAYTNSKFLASNPVPSVRTSWGAIEMISDRSDAIQHQLAQQAAAAIEAKGVEKIIGDFWGTGMDEAKINAGGIEPLQQELRSIEAIRDRRELVDYLRSSAAKGNNQLFNLSARADFKDSSRNIAYAEQGGLGLPDAQYYTSASNKAKLDAYEAHVAKVLELSGVSALAAVAQAKQVVAFEARLATASKTSIELSHDASLAYNPISPDDAEKLTPNWSWNEFFRAQGVPIPAMFSLAIPTFHQEVSKMIGDTDLAVWRAYLRFHTVDSASPYLSQPFVEERFAFYNKFMRGQKEITPRWQRVLTTINGQVGEALGQMYVKVAFSAESKAKMESLVANLRTALRVRIEELDWMSPETKTQALAKWETFTPKIGYPEKWRDWSGLWTARDSYLGNVRAATEYNYKWELSKIGHPVDKTEWGLSPQTVNAYYNRARNEIVFPAGIYSLPILT